MYYLICNIEWTPEEEENESSSSEEENEEVEEDEATGMPIEDRMKKGVTLHNVYIMTGDF